MNALALYQPSEPSSVVRWSGAAAVVVLVHAGLIALDLPGMGGVTTTVSLAATRAAQSLAKSFQTGKSADLVLPQPPSALELAGLDALLR